MKVLRRVLSTYSNQQWRIAMKTCAFLCGLAGIVFSTITLTLVPPSNRLVLTSTSTMREVCGGYQGYCDHLLYFEPCDDDMSCLFEHVQANCGHTLATSSCNTCSADATNDHQLYGNTTETISKTTYPDGCGVKSEVEAEGCTWTNNICTCPALVFTTYACPRTVVIFNSDCIPEG